MVSMQTQLTTTIHWWHIWPWHWSNYRWEYIVVKSQVINIIILTELQNGIYKSPGIVNRTFRNQFRNLTFGEIDI